ncbi:universal stress protein [Halosimplex rubrum]|uniref:Universal stress protein n=1 Tax=Halosimplex rubrum TaxID=869889 RepID=A0A7D5P6H9_9EURY|nr:universal stress protein [Halosimplex rubrum]QLH78518.1 universal stress protein [Halosimplex rubrum]
MSLDIEQVLVPVDATDQAEQAVRYGLAIADEYDAAVHVLHVIDEPVKRGIETGDVDAEAVADEQVSFADDADEFADDVPVTHSTVVGFSRSRLRQHPGSAILDVAEELPADFVVIPRERGTEPDETLGKSAQYVVEYASQPVLSV